MSSMDWGWNRPVLIQPPAEGGDSFFTRDLPDSPFDHFPDQKQDGVGADIDGRP